MYLSGDDFYLFCYSILILLQTLKCVDEKFFKDYRKLVFLIEFVINKKLARIINYSEDKILSSYDKNILFESYTRGLSRRSAILKLLFSMEKRSIINLKKNSKQQSIDVSLNKKNIEEFINNKNMFKAEYSNAKQIKKSLKRLSIINLDTFLENLYEDRGLNLWKI